MIAPASVHANGTGESNGYLRLDAHDRLPVTSLDTSVLVCGNASDALELLPDRCIRTVVTSPPYWSLRDYEIDRQIGRDDILADYVESIVQTFDKVRRVLADDGTVWLNVGDAYTSGNRRYRAPDRKNRARAMDVRPVTPEGLKPKDLIGVPWRLAFALQDAGWWLRSEVIWHKPNAHPESVRDRPTKAHETVFLLSKSQDYHYDIDAVRGPKERRLRTVWDIPTEPQKRNGAMDDHPAMMPMKLARRCVAITSRPGDVVLDPYAGSGTTLIAAQDLGRKWVGVELNPAYVDLVERRIGAGTPGMFAAAERTALAACTVHAEWDLAK
ncbi:MAG: site-specific DNA-methyltransferase [Spirochaetaceae bacterium]|nr:site-specific DNA-methyltransferase [Spirochaetaceae bacterium]